GERGAAHRGGAVSCLDGATLAAYAAGELPPLQRRNAGANLVRCGGCRARVIALRASAPDEGAGGEGRSDGERDAPPGGGFALGFGLALGVGALAIGAFERAAMRGEAGGSGLSPLRLSGAYEMLFGLVFWVRNRAPGGWGLGAALGATAR